MKRTPGLVFMLLPAIALAALAVPYLQTANGDIIEAEPILLRTDKVVCTASAQVGTARTVACQLQNAVGVPILQSRDALIEHQTTPNQGAITAASPAVGTLIRATPMLNNAGHAYMQMTAGGAFSFVVPVATTVPIDCIVAITVNDCAAYTTCIHPVGSRCPMSEVRLFLIYAPGCPVCAHAEHAARAFARVNPHVPTYKVDITRARWPQPTLFEPEVTPTYIVHLPKKKIAVHSGAISRSGVDRAADVARWVDEHTASALPTVPASNRILDAEWRQEPKLLLGKGINT
jgi:hypothetical protein